MNFDLTSLEQWWHEFIDHLFKHPQAEEVAHPAIAAVASAATTVAAPATSIPAHADPQNMSLAEKLIGRTAQTDAMLDSRLGKSVDPQSPELAKDGVIRYLHHTEVYAGRFTTEPLQGKTKLQLTYTSQEAGKTAPSQAWASVNGGPEQGPMQCGVAAEWDLGTSGTHTAVIRFDTNGRMIGQLVKG